MVSLRPPKSFKQTERKEEDDDLEKEESTLKPKERLTNTLDEARMILPGIQALFGFQLIAVFNPVFTSLSEPLKDLHFAALLLTILAAALLITPAAYDRQRNTACVSCKFIALVTKTDSTCTDSPIAFSIVRHVHHWHHGAAQLLPGGRRRHWLCNNNDNALVCHATHSEGLNCERSVESIRTNELEVLEANAQIL